MFIQRTVEKSFLNLLSQYPVVVVTGPRQSGKTTLVRHACPDKPYVLLEDLDIRQFAHDDPRGFLNQYPDGAVFDEVQRCPGLLSYLQGIIDTNQRPGQFVLTGSQQFGLRSNINQSLAGRVALQPLLPFSLKALDSASLVPDSLTELLWKGSYPPLYDRDYDPRVWCGNYIRTYLERDVRELINVRDLSTFQRFLRLCAGRSGQLVNLSNLAGDCGITHNTAKAWIAVLEASYIVYLLKPHHQNFNKRLVKTPKLYFLDTGLAAWLLGIYDPDQLRSHPLYGSLFETFVVCEFLKMRWHAGLEPNLYFWRDRSGLEVDLLIDEGSKIMPVEVKSGQTVAADFLKPIQRWQALAGDVTGSARLVYGGTARQDRTDCTVIPWRQLAEM